MRLAKRDRKMMFWVNQNEFEAIRASAEVNAVTVAEYIRCCAVGRPVKARNRLFRAVRQLERQKLQLAAQGKRQAEQAAERKRYLEQAKVMEKARLRREKAEALIRQAGVGVQGWWDGLSAKRREEWADLLPELLRAEKLAKEAEQAFEAHREMIGGEALSPPPRSTWRPPAIGGSYEPPALGPVGPAGGNFTKGRITRREPDPKPFDTDSGIIL